MRTVRPPASRSRRIVLRALTGLSAVTSLAAAALVVGVVTTPPGPLPAAAQDIGRSSSGAGSAELVPESAGAWLALSVHLDDAHLADRSWDHDRVQLGRALRAWSLPGSRLLFPSRTYGSSAEPGTRTGRPAASAPGLQEMAEAKAESAFAARDLLRTLGLPADVDLTFHTGDIQGPSAGLVMALAQIDAATPGPLTGGAAVAVTGEVDATGGVASIGGTAAKVELAVAAGAQLLLVPQDNLDEALTALRTTPGGHRTRVRAVTSVKDALAAICEHLAGAPRQVCTALAARRAAEREQARLLALAHGVDLAAASRPPGRR